MTKAFLTTPKVFQLMVAVWAVNNFVLGVDGDYNGCYDFTWIYHGHSHTCFKLYFNEYISWDEARSKCECHETRKGVCLKSWLARIHDAQTNQFVKGLMRYSYSRAYIGLYKVRGKEERWTGSNEVPTYHDFADNTSSSTFYTTIGKNGWVRSKGVERWNFLCQTNADNKRMTVECPRPVKVSDQTISDLTFYGIFDFSDWSSAEWTDSSASKVAECGSSRSCTSSADGQIYYTSSMSDDHKSTLTYRGEISREFEGVWALSIFQLNGQRRWLLDTKSCDLKVYELAEGIECNSEVTSRWILVNCTVKKVYPSVSCFWKFKYKGESEYVTAKSSDVIAPQSDEYTDVRTGYKYFTTQCQLNLTKQSLEFSVGTVIVKVRMAPNLGEYIVVPKSDRLFEQATFDIEKPETPVFKFANDTIIDTDVVSYSEGERIVIVCEVPGGKPEVYQTTMSCSFTINGFNKVDKSQDSRYRLDTLAVRGMNSATCLCWGHHITTPTKTSKIQFKIWFGPEKVEATLNSPAVIRLCPSPGPRELIDMTCDVPTSGVNPKPTVVVESQENVIEPVNENHTPALYSFKFSFVPNNGGILRVTCVASNPMIPWRKVESSTIVAVLEPPPSPPSMCLSNTPNGQRVDETNGQPVQVQCQVQGGYPQVSKVIMTCAGLQYEAHGTQLTQSIILDKFNNNNNNNNNVCYCHAVHPSDCYDLSTTFTFNVQYTIYSPTNRRAVAYEHEDPSVPTLTRKVVGYENVTQASQAP